MITRFNAADKLLQHVKNTKYDNNQSNKWNLMVEIEKVKKEEEEELKQVREIFPYMNFLDNSISKRKRN